MATAEATDSYRFQAEIRQLLNILVHSLYQDREIFLRELISNASDALTQLHFHMLTDRNVYDAEAELAIRLAIEERDGSKWLVVKDSGIGMTAEELIQNLGTIAQSGARAFLQKVRESDTSPGDIIGQFGVGFYSVFMVADEVRVISRSYRPEAEAAAWVSAGDDTFKVESASKEDRGTEIHIKLKEDASEFASEWKLRDIVKRHSDFVGYPIYWKDEQLNQQQPLWRKSPPEVSSEEYTSFYKQMTMDFEEPLTIIHFHSDAPIHVRALLFVPASRDRGVLALRKEAGLKLYSQNVLIQEYNKELLPEWLRFVDGVIESEDLPLNVSRETVQSNRFMRQMGKTLRRRVVRALEELSSEDAPKYATFWKQHGRTLKEGLIADPGSLNEVLPLLRYHSTNAETELTSLKAYAQRMSHEQEALYYVLGDSLHAVANSPHLDPFRARELEVLYWIDPLDSFLAPLIKEFDDKPVKNIDDAGLELPDYESGEADEGAILADAVFNRFIGRCVTVLGNRVQEVRASRMLKTSPIRLVSPGDSADRDMQRLYRFLDENYEVPKRILEVNRNHPLIADLARIVTERPSEAIVDLSIEQLYESALVQEGLHPDPARMVPRIEQLLALAASAHAAELGESEQDGGGTPEAEETA